MIQQPAGVTDAQRRPDVRIDVELTAEPFGHVPGAPMLEWLRVVDELMLGDVMAAVGLADGSLLRLGWEVGDTALRVGLVVDPTAASSWTDLSWSAVGPEVTGTVLRVAAARDGDAIRVAWATGAGIFSAITDDAGVTWSATETIYSGADVDDRHIGVFRSGGHWIVGWSTKEPRGMVAWVTEVTWTTFSYWKNYRFAGAHVVDGFLSVWTFTDLSLPTVGTSKVRMVSVNLATATILPRVVDSEEMIGGDMGTNFYDLFYRDLFDDDGCLLGQAIEGGVGGGFTYTLSSTFDGQVGGGGDAWDWRIDEPVQARWQYEHLYDSVPTSRNELAAAAGVVYAIKPRGNYGEVWAGRPVTVPAGGYEVISYEYDLGEGRAFVELSPDGEIPVVGSLLTLTRRLVRAGRSGEQAIKMLVIAIEQHRDRVRILALDASGWMGVYRARRTVRISDGVVDLWVAVPRLTARGGLRVRLTDEVGDRTSFNITHGAGESAAGALYRLVGTGSALLCVVPGEFAIQMSTIGDNCSGPHRYGGAGIPIADVHKAIDGRRYSASYMVGQRTTDPADGSYLGGWLGPALPGVRPQSVSYTNSRYNSPLLVSNAAEAEAMRQLSLHVDVVVTAGPNLGLELYDRVRVTLPEFGWREREFRLHDLVERWDRHGMVQELRLGDVCYMYDLWGEDDCSYDFG